MSVAPPNENGRRPEGSAAARAPVPGHQRHPEVAAPGAPRRAQQKSRRGRVRAGSSIFSSYTSEA
jgi:hypothetical protein